MMKVEVWGLHQVVRVVEALETSEEEEPEPGRVRRGMGLRWGGGC